MLLPSRSCESAEERSNASAGRSVGVCLCAHRWTENFSLLYLFFSTVRMRWKYSYYVYRQESDRLRGSYPQSNRKSVPRKKKLTISPKIADLFLNLWTNHLLTEAFIL